MVRRTASSHRLPLYFLGMVSVLEMNGEFQAVEVGPRKHEGIVILE